MISKSNSFITNEGGNTLLNEFNLLLKDTEFFDCLVGYFYVSGFHKLQKSLENSTQIRILVGMGIDSQTFHLIEDSQATNISTAEYKKQMQKDLIHEMNNSNDTADVEKGIRQFVSWLQSGKLEIRGYKERKTHSKLYIMTFKDEHIDIGRVITGSSNFSQPGLERNLEFNVELREPSDYEFASDKFEELWEHSEPISEEFINTINHKTWLKDDITPYELFLKFIYEYLKDKIDNDKKELEIDYVPEGFKYLDYQRDAVLDAKDKLHLYNGVFLADVVGLGKTYMGALLAQNLRGRTLVIAPPALVKEHNPGGWKRVLREFSVVPTPIVESKGKLDQILEKYDDDFYQNVIIDESHDFRNEDTKQYEYLSKICKDKNVILISATPFNNSPSDLLSQIKLFQPAHKSRLPNPEVEDLEAYFNRLDALQNSVSRDDNPQEYLKISKQISKDIRENVLQYLMVRRTRSNISKYYAEDLKRNNMEFPNVKPPEPVYYYFDDYIDEVFEETLYLLNENLFYAKYRPLAEEYRLHPDTQYSNSQKMMGNFIKILLIKRLESGSYAFKKSIDNSIKIHEAVLENYRKKGVFYTSRDYNWKVYNLMEDGDIDKIEEYIEQGKVKEYFKKDFTDKFEIDLNSDLQILKYIKRKWDSITDYPKRWRLIELLNNELKNKKVILFTEFIDTAENIVELISQECEGNVKLYTGNSSKEDMDDVLNNFDANVSKENQKNDYRILVATDTLSHGVNLHRSNVIINYDIPWNPTKMMQRVGRVQRLGTEFKDIEIYNFFPTNEIEDEVQVKFLAEKKIAMFIELLGNDSQLLTDEPIQSFDLFNKLTSIDEDDELVNDELKYLALIRDIRDNNIELFKKIEELPKKARVARNSDNHALISLMKSDTFKKVFKTTDNGTEEIDFFEAIKELEADENEKQTSVDEDYYYYLAQNKLAFEQLRNLPKDKRNMKPTEKSILKSIRFALKYKKILTNKQIKDLNKFKELITDGYIGNAPLKKISKELKQFELQVKEGKISEDDYVFVIINTLMKYASDDLKTDLTTCIKECYKETSQIILSEYFVQ